MDDSSSEDDPRHNNGAPLEHYNPLADDKDTAFAKARIRGRKLITDGTLSCPSCFTILCYECQQLSVFIFVQKGEMNKSS